MAFLYVVLAWTLSALLLPFNNFIGYDGVYYAWVAQSLLEGRGLAAGFDASFTHPPFYSFLIAVLSPLFRGDFEFAGHLISLLAFGLILIPLFSLAKQVYGVKTAHWTSLLFTTHGFLLMHSNLVMAEIPFLCLVMMQLAFLHQIIQGTGRTPFVPLLAGVAGGLAYLTRPEGLFFSVLGFLSILFLSAEPPLLRRKAVLVAFTGFLLFFIPYSLFVWCESRKVPLTGAMTELAVMAQRHAAHPDQYLEMKKIYEGLTADKTRHKIEELIENFNLGNALKADDYALLRQGLTAPLHRLFRIDKYLFEGVGWLLIGVSLFSLPWDPSRKRTEFLFLIFFLSFLPTLSAVFIPKRYLVYFPLLLLWIGHGLERMRHWALGSFRLSERGSRVPILIFFLALAGGSAWYVHRIVTQFPMPFEHKELGLWAKENLPGIENEGLAARHRSVNYYCGARVLRLPYVEKFEDFLTYMDHQKAKYFAVSSDLDPPLLGAYQFLLDETKPPPAGIVRRHIVQKNRKVILYEIAVPSRGRGVGL